MGIFSEPTINEAYVGTRQVVCLVCACTTFWERRVKLNSAASELFDLAWASESSLMLTCTGCGFKMEFTPTALRLTPVN